MLGPKVSLGCWSILFYFPLLFWFTGISERTKGPPAACGESQVEGLAFLRLILPHSTLSLPIEHLTPDHNTPVRSCKVMGWVRCELAKALIAGAVAFDANLCAVGMVAGWWKQS